MADTEETLEQKLARAKREYQDRKGTEDWAEVAQMLGRAGAQYGAAQAGVPGIDKMRLIPEVDYSRRREELGREYRTDIEGIGELARQVERGKEKEAEAEYRKQRLGLEKDKLSKEPKPDTQMRALIYRDLQEQENDLQRQLAGISKEESSLEQDIQRAMSNVDSKTQKKWEAESPGYARLRSQLEGVETLRPGWLGGKTAEEEQKEKDKIITEYKKGVQDKTEEVKSLLSGVSQAKQQLLGGQKPQIQTATVPSHTNKKEVKRQVNQKTGQVRIVYSDGSTEILEGRVAGGAAE